MKPPSAAAATGLKANFFSLFVPRHDEEVANIWRSFVEA